MMYDYLKESMTEYFPGLKDTPTLRFMKLTLFVQVAGPTSISDGVTLLLKRLNTFVTNAVIVVLGFEVEEVLPKDLTKSMSPSKKRKKKLV
jgi:hypothetical protein